MTEDRYMQPLDVAVAVFVGAMIPVILFFLEKWWDRRIRVQEWFAAKYIENGIDVLDDFFRRWATISSLPTFSVKDAMVNPAFDEVPHQAIARLGTFTKIVHFQNWFNAMRKLRMRAIGQNDCNSMTTFHCHAASMCEHLNRLRQGLLARNVKRKTDVYKLRELACVKTFNNTLNELTEKLVDNPNVTKFTAKTKDQDDEQ